MRFFALLALTAAIAVTAPAQNLPAGEIPPSQLPAGQPSSPPPQPGQVAPPDSKPKAPAAADVPAPNSADVPAPSSGVTILPGVTTQVVLVPASVLDPDGHGYVNGLTASDFEVYDNDKLQKVNAEYTEQPVSVVLAIQANAEIEPVLPQLKRTGLLFQGLVSGQDGDVAVLSFDHRLQHLQDFTNDPAKLDDATHKLTAGSSSARVIDAVLDADRMLKHHDPRGIRRRVIILVSRNIDKGSESHLQETVRSMQFDNVIVYCIDISKVLTALLDKPGYPRPQNGGIPPEALPNIAGASGPRSDTSVIQQENGNVLNAAPVIYRGIRDLFKKTPAEAFSYFTGGKLYSFATERTLESAIQDIGADLNSQYLLSYVPNDKNEPGFHNIRVVVNRPGLKIRSRPGYWWGGGSQP